MVLPICCSSGARAQSPIWGTGMRFFPEVSQGMYNMSANSKGSGETALMRRLAWVFAAAYVISTLFSCAGTFSSSILGSFFYFQLLR